MQKVSVILTSYNRPNSLVKAIDSVLNQTHKEIDLFIVDDNSCENVRNIILKKSKEDNRIIHYFSDINDSDRGKSCRYAVLINHVLKNMCQKNSLITYLTDDSLYFDNRLDKFIDVFKDPNINVAYDSQKVVDLVSGINYYRYAQDILRTAFHIVDHCSVMHRYDILNQTGFWEEDSKYWRDCDAYFWEKIRKAGFKFYPVNNIGEVNYIHKKSISVCMSNKLNFTDGLRE